MKPIDKPSRTLYPSTASSSLLLNESFNFEEYNVSFSEYVIDFLYPSQSN